MNRELHFPTPIYIFDHNDLSINIDLEKNILNWASQDEGINRTNIKGWHSNTQMHHRPEFKKLEDALYEAQYKLYEQEHLDSEPFLGSMWANVNPKGGMNRAHLHPNSLWSGVYYVKAPKNCGLLRIDDPRTSSAMTRPKLKKGNIPHRLFRELNYEPQAGRLIMFPSWVTHCVDPNESDELRISVSFNFLQKGMYV